MTLNPGSPEARLAAHAPAAVAEVIRLRREIATMRDRLASRPITEQMGHERGMTDAAHAVAHTHRKENL